MKQKDFYHDTSVTIKVLHISFDTDTSRYRLTISNTPICVFGYSLLSAWVQFTISPANCQRTYENIKNTERSFSEMNLLCAHVVQELLAMADHEKSNPPVLHLF